MDVLYVSPHPDDVAFSAAARVERDVAAGHSVSVITLFAPQPGSGSATLSDLAARRAEDDAFAAGARVRMLDGGSIDAIARRPRYRAPRHLFGPLAADEEPLIEEMRARLQSLGAQKVVAPLGIGQHVDHQIAFEAARRLRGVEVLFYEDTPYVLTPYQLGRRVDRLGLAVDQPDPTLARGSVRQELGASARAWLNAPLLKELARPPHHLLALASILVQSELFHWPRRPSQRLARFTPDLVADDGAKLRAVAAYPSQWCLFFPSLDAWRLSLENYSARMGQSGIVERAWRLE